MIQRKGKPQTCQDCHFLMKFGWGAKLEATASERQEKDAGRNFRFSCYKGQWDSYDPKRTFNIDRRDKGCFLPYVADQTFPAGVERQQMQYRSEDRRRGIATLVLSIVVVILMILTMLGVGRDSHGTTYREESAREVRHPPQEPFVFRWGADGRTKWRPRHGMDTISRF